MIFKLRAATRADVTVLLEIERASFTNPLWVAQDFLKYPCTVAEADGQIAGFLVVRETFAGDKQYRPEREILNLATAPRFRRLGVAKLLLESELLAGANYFLEVRESNVGARTLYSHFGFQEIGRREKYYHNPAETAIVMQMK